MMRIDGLSINLTGPLHYGPDGKQRGSGAVASIRTDLDLGGDGQKTVAGKSRINSGGDALILVIVPRVIE